MFQVCAIVHQNPQCRLPSHHALSDAGILSCCVSPEPDRSQSHNLKAHRNPKLNHSTRDSRKFDVPEVPNQLPPLLRLTGTCKDLSANPVGNWKDTTVLVSPLKKLCAATAEDRRNDEIAMKLHSSATSSQTTPHDIAVKRFAHAQRRRPNTLTRKASQGGQP